MARAAPQRRRGGERRRGGHVAAHDLEQLADQALGRPVDEPDAPAGTADARQLVRDDLMARGELDAEGGDHAIEDVVLERDLLGVSLDPVDGDVVGDGARPRRVEQLGREVEPDDRCARGRGADREVPRCRRRRRAPPGRAGGMSIARQQIARRGRRRCGGRRRRNHRRPRWRGASSSSAMGSSAVVLSNGEEWTGECPRPPLREPCENPAARRPSRPRCSYQPGCSGRRCTSALPRPAWRNPTAHRGSGSRACGHHRRRARSRSAGASDTSSRRAPGGGADSRSPGALATAMRTARPETSHPAPLPHLPTQRRCRSRVRTGPG